MTETLLVGDDFHLAKVPHSTKIHVGRLLDRLQEDPQTYVSGKWDLQECKLRLTMSIMDTANKLLVSTKTPDEKAPELQIALSSTKFARLCTRLYGVSRKADIFELCRKSGTAYRRSKISLIDLLRALIAFAITKWVFDGECETLGLHSLMKPEMTEYQRAVEKSMCS